MRSLILNKNNFYRLRALKATLFILLSVVSCITLSKQLTFDFSSDHGLFLFGHEINEFSQYVEISGDIKLTVTPKSTATPHLQHYHNFDQPNDIYVHQSFSGLGVKYRPKHFWMPPFLDSGYLDTYSGYTDRLSFEFTSVTTGESLPVTVKAIRFKRFEPILFLDDAYIQDTNTGDVINVSKHNINKDLFLELFPTSYMDTHTFGFWRFDTSFKTNDFVITPGKFDAFKVYSITVEASDAEDQAPEIISTPLETAKEGHGYTYQVVTASNARDYHYTLNQAPSGMLIDESTGAVSWTPNFEQAGAHLVEVTVTDSQGRLTNQTYNLVVENHNRAPLITSDAILTAQENGNYQYPVQAIDPDGDSLSFQLSLAPVGMAIDEQGNINWQPSFEQAGHYEVLVSVSDGQLSVGQNYSVTVENVNRLPTIAAIPVNSINEADEYLHEVQASDLDGDVLSYTLQAAPSGMSISQQGQISWLPSHQQAGNYAITVNVSDGTAVVALEFVLMVENVNRIPVITSAPIIGGIENTPYTYSLDSFDADGDLLSYTLPLSPAGMVISASGSIDWTPSFNQAGDHSVIVRVSDASSNTEHAFVVSVANTNRAPIISSAPHATASENASYQYAVSATDDDLDALSYRLTVSPDGMSIDTGGVINWLPSYDQAGTHAVSLKVSDGKSVDTQAFDIAVSNTNRAPIINSNAIKSAVENSAYQYQVMAADADSQNLTYQLEIAPLGMSISAAGLISWLPSFQQAGDHSVIIVVSDPLAAVKQEYTLAVTNTNRLPKITSQPPATAKENTQYIYAVQAEDDDAEALTYQLVQAPQGMAIDALGSVSWTPTFDQSGMYSISIAVKDGSDTVNHNFDITAENTNRAPMVSPAGILTVHENTALVYEVIATDPDGDAVSYTLISAPSGMSINASGQINWIPTFEQAGEHQLVLRVSDQALATEQAFTIIVANVNRIPTVTPISDANISENEAFSYQVEASDADFDALSYALTSAPAGMLINASGSITWTPDFNQAGSRSIVIVVADAESHITLSFIINVADTNRLPEITSTPLLTTNENEPYQYQVLATDDDQNPLTFSLGKYPFGMSINAQGLISWTPDFSQAGEHEITALVSDGINITEQSYTLLVTNINRAPAFSSTPLTDVFEKETYQYTAVANDPDGDALQYGLVIAPPGVTINATTGIVQWETTADSIGSYYLVISAVDALLSQAEQGFTLTVLNVNDAPVITSQPVVTGAENQAYEYQIMATDEDGDGLIYAVTSAPAGMSINTSSGHIRWLPSFNQSGVYNLSVIVSDSHGLSTTQDYALQVSNVNRAPIIASAANKEAEINKAYVYQVLATEPDSEALKYELSTAPAGMLIDESTGLINWQPNNAQLGEFNVEVVVTDPHMLAASQSFSVQVTSSNQAPTILSEPTLTAIVGYDYKYSINVVDAEQDILSFTILQAPDFLSISLEGVLSGIPAISHIGVAEVKINISDGINSLVHSYNLNTIELAEADPANWGKDFWFLDALNGWDAYADSPALRIFITSKVDTQGVIESPRVSSKAPQEFTVLANQVTTIDYLSIKESLKHDAVSSRGIHVSADDNISVYVLLYSQHNTDAMSLIPTDALGVNYRLSGYRISANSAGEYAIVATSDNTQLTITPSAQISRSGKDDVMKGDSYSVTLNKGDVYSLLSEGKFSLDLSGSSVKSNEPVSVFTVHGCSNVPTTDKYCDRLTEQLPSVKQWGYRHALVPLYTRYGDLVRILADKNNTRVSIDGAESKLLQAGEFWEYMLHDAQWVSSNEPVLITQFSTSDTNDKVLREQDENHFLTSWSKPYGNITSQILDDSVNYLTEYTVNIDTNNKSNSVILVVPDDQRDAILVDGVALSESLFPNRNCGSTCTYAPYNLDYAIGQVALPVGEHTITAGVPFGMYENIYSLFRMADPFMAVVPPIELSQDTYIFTTPVTEYARHFVNVVLPSEAVGSLRIDGELVDSGYFSELSEDEFSYARLAINAGRHNISADQNFSLLVYGFDSHDSYGFIGGFGHSSPLTADHLSLSANTLQPIAGEQFCVSAQVTDAQHMPLEDTAVTFNLSGVHAASGAVFTEVDGIANYCYLGYEIGVDKLLAEINGLSQNLSLEWQPSSGESTAPVIISTPVTYVVAQESYEYNVEALDPEGEELTYSLKASPVDMTIDSSSGLITWQAVAGTYKVLVEVIDTQSNASQQLFSIVVNSLPVIIEYPANPVDNKSSYRSQYKIEDPDGDSVFCQFISGNSHFYMNRDACTIVDVSGMPAGDYPFSVKISDGRGGDIEHSFVLHVVQSHSPVITNTDLDVYGFINETMTFDVQATDANNDPLSFRKQTMSAKLNGKYFDISKLILDQENLSVQWTPIEDEFGTLEVIVVVDHPPFNYTASESIFFHVENRDFSITSLPIGNARVGVEYQYAITLEDPDDQSMSYSLLDSPVGMTVDENGVVRWTPTDLQEGFAAVKVQVNDGKNIHGQEFELSVQSFATQMTTQLIADKRVVESEEVINVSGGYLNSLGNATETLTLDGAVIALDENGKAQITIGESGAYTVTYTVKDNTAEISKSIKVYVKDPNDVTPAIVNLITPAQGDSVTAELDVTATITDEQLIYWQLLLQKGNRGDASILAEGESEITAASIASIDPTLMLNGLYTLTLIAVDLGGNESFSQVVFPIDGNLKVGNMSFTVEDLSIPVAGIPISVTRTFDSRRRHEDLDFGYGWSIDYQNIQVDESLEPTQGWYQYESYSRFVSGSSAFNSKSYCIAPIGEKQVSITLPDGSVERFQTTAKAVDGGTESTSHTGCYFTSGRYYQIEFVAQGNTKSQLHLGEHNEHSFYLTDFDNGDFVADIIEGSYTPINQYLLTTQSGYLYHLDQNFGIKTVTDPNGHVLTYSEQGITHSSGKSVVFNRDANGRIDSIVNPAGDTVIEYQYSSAGDLRFAKDAIALEEGASGVEYTYTLDHNIVDIIDPLGRKLVKNIYDDEGRLTGQEDADGNVKTFDHDINAGTSLITDLDGRSTLFNYDEKGNVTQDIKIITDGRYDSDIVTTLQYDDNDNQTHKTIGNSEYTWLSSFDDDSNQLTAIDPQGNIVEYQDYNARGQEGTIIDELGRKTGMTYDGAGNLTNIEMPTLTDADSGAQQNLSASNKINVKGQVIQTTDLRGLVTTYTYYSSAHAAADQKHTEHNEISGTTTYAYDANNNMKTESRERTIAGEVITETVTYDYDKRDRLTKTLYPDSSFVQTEYDLAGNVDRARDRFGTWTDYDYDAYGRLLKTTYTDGTFESRTYSAEGLLKSVTDVSNHTTAYKYDDASRLWKTTYHDASFTETRYTQQGWIKSEKDARGNITQYQYDLAGKREAVVRFEGEREIRHSFTYYKNGELKTETDANVHTTQYGINEYDQRIQTDFHNGTLSQQRYDAMGARTQQIDQNSRATQYGYDDLGRLKSVQALVQINAEDVPATTYTYDEAGNKLTQTDAIGRTTTWTYDYYGRVLTRTLPEGMSESFHYDDATRSVIHTDFNGNITTTVSDAMSRTNSITYNDGIVQSFSYWPNGQVKTTTESQTGKDDQVTSYSYDNLDRLKTETQADGTVLGYEYDANGNRTQVKVTRGEAESQTVTTTDYTYDALNRLTTVVDASGTTTYSYDDVGNQKTVTYPNGLMTEYIYNDVNQLKNLTTKNANGEVLSSYSYELENTGRREAITEQDGRYTDYRYDNLYRLTDEIIKQGIDAAAVDYSANYQYDWVGNRTYETVDGVSRAYSYDLNDRLTSQGGTTYSYDDNGNTLTETLDSKVKTYSYDAKNKLIGVSTTESDVEVSSSAYSYNVSGIRNSKTEGGVTTSYVVDSNRDYAQVLEEIVNGLSTVTYSYGHDLLSQNREEDFRFYQYDALGSTRNMSNSTGVITDSYDYEAFGEVLTETGTTENNYKFTGEQFDTSLDRYYLRARYYDQGIGRFTQQDTWVGSNSRPITLNKYLYADVDPVANVDPSGYMSLVSSGTVLSGMSLLSNIAVPSFSNLFLGVTVGVGFSILYQDINFVFNVDADPESSTVDEVQKQAEYEKAKRFCDDQKPNPGRNDCSTISKLIDHAEQCISMYEDWDDKWYNGRHDEKIRDWNNRVEKLKREHKKRCTR